jgi:hypothetical protein
MVTALYFCLQGRRFGYAPIPGWLGFYEISPRALLVYFVFIHFVLVNPKTICIFATIIKTIGV